MTIKERIEMFIERQGIRRSIFEKSCGFSNGYIRNLKENPSASKIEDILKSYPEINRVWLLTGEGGMLRSVASSSSSVSSSSAVASSAVVCIPLLPIAARGGSLCDWSTSVRECECERVVSPISGAELAMGVSGDSMSPEYPNGSQILLKKINEAAFIEWGKVYVLDTCNGAVVKVLVPSEREGYVRCVSINKDPIYAPFDVALADVYGVYRVLMCMAVK